MKILIAVHSKMDFEVLAASLKKMGHEVISATHCEQTMELCIVLRPDLILLDVELEEECGFYNVKKLRECLNKINKKLWIPIIFLSRPANNESILQGLNAGGDDYLIVPVDDITLAIKIRAMQRIVDMQKNLSSTTSQISLLSSIDTLTGINNRSQFDKTLREKFALAKQSHSKLALLLIDLDNFKEINDHLGHNIGDLLLKEVAKRLKQCVREEDFLARLGGDEFAIILDKINHSNDASLLAKKVLEALKPVYHLPTQDIHISCSIGIACSSIPSITPDILIQHADIAMYYAKELGRNNFQFYSKNYRLRHKQRFFIENALRFALDNNELFMCYQPIFQLKTKKLVGMEALMRWQNPQLGIISPDVFIPIAEEIGLIFSIGNWALRNVCEQAIKWYSMGYKNFKLTVNISSRQLLHVDMLKSIKHILQETQLPPNLLEFELTESTVMSSSNMIEKTIKEITDMNIGISLDDFGTGYSSLSHLKRLPIKALKIDKSFVMDTITDPNDALIVKSIISLGKILNLNLIAEGIETEEQLQFLIKNKCQEGQGFYLSEPLTAEEMSLFLMKKKNKAKE